MKRFFFSRFLSFVNRLLCKDSHKNNFFTILSSVVYVFYCFVYFFVIFFCKLNSTNLEETGEYIILLIKIAIFKCCSALTNWPGLFVRWIAPSTG